MFHMQFMRSRHIDRVYISIAQHRIIIGIGYAAKIVLKAFASITTRRAGRKKRDIWMRQK